jgi:hypothetical protein
MTFAIAGVVRAGTDFLRVQFLLFVICVGSGVHSKTGCHDTILSACKRRVDLRAGIHRRVSGRQGEYLLMKKPHGF